MKKYLMMALTVVVMACVNAPVVSAQTEKEIKEAAKKAEKDGKATAKELKKGKWEYLGAGTLESALIDFNKLTAPGGSLLGDVRTVTAPSVAIGEQKARANVQSDFALEVRTALAEKSDEINKLTEADGDIGANGTTITTVERRAVEELKGDLIKRFTIYKKEGGKYEVRVYYTKPNLNSPKYRQRIESSVEEMLKQQEMISKSATSK